MTPNLPVFQLVINEGENSDIEVQAMALVDKPAIERNFLAFASNKVCFTTVPDQHIVFGPAMIPDTLIYRRDDQGEYNVFFSKDTIEKIALKFFKKGYEKNVNLFHDQSLATDSVTIFQSFISNQAMGISPMKGYEDLPDGTWFIGAKIEDEKIWQMVTSGQIKGFSVEGIFSYQKKQQPVASKLIEQLRETLATDCLFNEMELMNVKEMMSDFKQKFFGEPAAPAAPAPDITHELAADSDMINKCKQCISACQACVDAGVAEPCFSACQACITTCNAVVSDPSEQNMMACVDACKQCIEACGQFVNDPNIGEICTKCVTSCQDCLSVMSSTPSADPAAAPAAPAAPAMGSNYDSQFAEINSKFSSYEQKFASYEAKFAEYDGKLNKANETIVALVGIVEKLSETPTADPVGSTKNNFSSNKAKSKDEARQDLINLFKSKTK